MPWKTVVGVVADMRRQRLDEPAIPYMFQPGVIPQMDIAVRTAGDPELLRDAIRAEMRALDPTAPPYGIVTVEQRLGATVALRRLQTMLLVALAAVALMLSVIGAYGVIHQSVAARTQEIGIRMALGANAAAVLRMVLAGGLAPAVIGVALGLAGIAGAEPDDLVVPVRNQPAGSADLRRGRCSLAGGDDSRLSGAGQARVAGGSHGRASSRIT